MEQHIIKYLKSVNIILKHNKKNNNYIYNNKLYNLFINNNTNNNNSINVIVNKIKRYELFNNKYYTFSILNNSQPEHYMIYNYTINNNDDDCRIINKKRKLDNNEDTSNNKKHKDTSNKKKHIDIDWKNMVSGSSVRNYFLKDPLLDWLSYYNIKNINDIPNKKNIRNNVSSNIVSSNIVCNNNIVSSNIVSNNNVSTKLNITKKNLINYTHTQYIMEQGNIYENNIYSFLKDNYDTIKIANDYYNRDEFLFNETIKYMKLGTPIIYQGVLHNYNNNTYGSPDLMIRSDYINDIFGYTVIDDEEIKLISPKLNLSYFYIIIDIKFSTIYFSSDELHILNSNNTPAYKSQILIYNLALQNISGLLFNKSFILGKDFKFGISKLGLIDYENSKLDSIYKNTLNNALEWVRLVRNEGHNWKLLPIPTIKELYPNMNNKKDDPYKNIKSELAEKIYEITQIWNVQINHRNNAHNLNINSWNDPNCNTNTLGIKGKNAIKIDNILNINRSDTDIIKPDVIKYNENNWRLINDNELEFYIDYETITSNIDVTSNNIYNNFIFMIGVGYIDNSNNWIYKCFISKNINGESKMLVDFWIHINQILKLYNKTDPRFIHWCHAEKTTYNKKLIQYPKLPQKNLIDLNKVFIEESIYLKGALNYTLKSIAKSMFNHNLISSTWNENSKCVNGLDALLIATNFYNKNTDITDEISEIQEIKKYNEIDCKVLYEIINYLRINH